MGGKQLGKFLSLTARGLKSTSELPKEVSWLEDLVVDTSKGFSKGCSNTDAKAIAKIPDLLRQTVDNIGDSLKKIADENEAEKLEKALMRAKKELEDTIRLMQDQPKKLDHYG